MTGNGNENDQDFKSASCKRSRESQLIFDIYTKRSCTEATRMIEDGFASFANASIK